MNFGIFSHGVGKLSEREGEKAVGKLVLTGETLWILQRAAEEARHLGHGQVGSEHLLLALLLQKHSWAAWLLERCGWEPVGVRQLILRNMGQGEADLPLVQGLTMGACRVLQTAAGEAGRLCGPGIRPEHLLLAISRNEETAAARLLAENGTELNDLFTELYMNMGSGMPLSRPNEGGMTMRLLEQFCEDLLEKGTRMDPVVGREEEIEAVQNVLCRKNKNNPALIGEPGVGKTAVVEGLAQRMAAGRVPEQLQGKRLLSLNMASVLAGTKYRGEFEERIRDILQEIRRCGNVILFVDEMHTLAGAGSAEGAIDAANLLKPALGRGEIQLIGATTLEEYRKHIEKDAALERRFRPVIVREPSPGVTMNILEALRPGLERHHRLKISKEAMEAAVELSCRYLTDHFLPDKAVDLLDEAAARAGNRHRGETGEESRQKLDRELRQAVREHRFEQAAAIRDKLQQMMRQQRSLLGRHMLEPEDVAATVAQRTGIPVGKLKSTDRERLLGLGAELSRRVLGQEEAVAEVTRAVCRGRLGLADNARPVASMLFLGPTGVGKTALCKALADCVYGSQDALVRLDMSEYMEQHAVSRLLGAPPGYVGHGEGGELTERVRRRPYCVVLLDEVEKAHRDVTGILLQVMEDGVLTDSMGRHVDFRNAIVVMTSNLGSASHSLDAVGFLSQNGHSPGEKAAREFFSPEFLGRLDCVTTFRSLQPEVLQEIALQELKETAKRAEKAGVTLKSDTEAAACLAGQCFGKPGGARELRRRIRREVEAPLAEWCLKKEGSLRLITAVREGKLVLEEEKQTS